MKAANFSMSPARPPCSAPPMKAGAQPFYDLSIVSPDGGAVTSNCGRGDPEPQDRRPARHLAGGRRLARPESRYGARRPAALVAHGGAQGEALRLGVHRRVRPGGSGAARRQARGDALGKLRAPGPEVSSARGRRRFALRRRRQDLDLGGSNDRHRHGAGPGRSRPWRCHGEPDRAAFRALRSAARIPVAIQPAAAGPDRWQRRRSPR